MCMHGAALRRKYVHGVRIFGTRDSARAHALTLVRAHTCAHITRLRQRMRVNARVHQCTHTGKHMVGVV